MTFTAWCQKQRGISCSHTNQHRSARRAGLLTLLILLTTVAGYTQTVTLKFRNEPLAKVFREIEKQTDFTFVYGKSLLDNARKVDIAVEKVPLKIALDICFKDQGLSYAIRDNRYIVVTRAAISGNVSTSQAVPLVRGRVTDETGVPLAGVTVKTTHKSNSTMVVANTDANGYFNIRVPDNTTLEYSMIGYHPFSGIARQEENQQIKLALATSRLEELIITGYSARSAKEVTGAVQKVTGDELRKGVATPNALSMLKGKTTGLYITETSGEAGAKGQVIERGQSSLPVAPNTNPYYGPLLVVDGVITNYQALQDAVNPADVEDITILKDASSTAIYGSRAAQGVIVVTTKRGKQGKLSANLTMQYGALQPKRNIRFMTTSELISFMDKQMVRYWEQTPSIRTQFPNVNDFVNQRRTYSDADRNNNFNWEDAIYSNGDFRNTELSINSGSEKTKFYGGIAWYKENGALYDNSFDRKSIRLNIDQQISPRFTATINISSMVDVTEKRNGIPELYMIQPFMNPYNPDGTLADSIPVKQSNNYGPAFTTWTQNFLAETPYDNTRITKFHNHLGALKLKYDIFPWLYIQSSNSLTYTNSSVNSYLDPRSYSGKYGGFPYLFTPSSPILPNGTLQLDDRKATDYLTSNTLNFRKGYGKHSVSALIGQEWGKRTLDVITTNLYNMMPGERNAGAAKGIGDAIYLAYITPATPPAVPTGSYAERATFSVFGQADYNYDQRYYATLSARTDATTNFGRDKRYGTFYSVSGGWLLSRESFLVDNKTISTLRLRAAYGTSGRDLGDAYMNTTLYTDGARYGAQNNIGSTISQLANPSISWETMYNTNLGLDAGLWDRVQVTLDVYHKRSAGLLQQVTLTSAQGSLSQYQNIGEIINKGLELMLNTHNVKSPRFNWHTNFNISFNRNNISALYQDSLRDNYSGAYYRKIGEDINVIKAIRYVGINPANGHMIHENFDASEKRVEVEGIGATAKLANWQVVGSATPKFFGGFTNTFKFDNFTLNVEWWFQYGNYVMMALVNNFQSPTSPRLGRNNVVFGSNQRIWEKAGDTDANYPDIFSTNPNAWSALTYRSSRLWGDASHARLRNVRLSYDLPQRLVRQWKMQNISVYVSGDNLAVLKKKDFVGADPEGATLGSSTAYGGVGIGFANSRRYLAGLNVSF